MNDEPDAKQIIPATDCEVLQGWHQIGSWQGISAETARARAKRDNLPVAKPIGWNRPIAIKAELNAALIEIARRAQRRAQAKKAEPVCAANKDVQP
jgi:hypothetical protein